MEAQRRTPPTHCGARTPPASVFCLLFHDADQDALQLPGVTPSNSKAARPRGA